MISDSLIQFEAVDVVTTGLVAGAMGEVVMGGTTIEEHAATDGGRVQWNLSKGIFQKCVPVQ